MTITDSIAAEFGIKIGGKKILPDFLNAIFEVEVEQSIHLPSVFTIRVHLGATGQSPFDVIDGLMKDYLSQGSEVEISQHFRGRDKHIMTGEINSVSLDLSSTVPGSSLSATIQGYDKSHRLHRGRKTRTFLQSTYSEAVKKVVGEAGLNVAVDSTSGSQNYIIQHNETDWDFVSRIASRLGYELYFDDGKLHFKKPGEGNPRKVKLVWERDLVQFRVRASTAFQNSEVTVLGWDPIKKARIVGTAAKGNGSPKTGESRSGADQAKSAFGSSKVVMVDMPMSDQEEAKSIAQSLADTMAGDFVTAEGVTFGNPDLAAGVTAEITGIGERFSGEYHVTSTTHLFNRTEGYSTSFVVSGRSPHTLLDLVESGASPRQTVPGGVVVGEVTNIKDPDGLSRVKVKFPWLSDDLESDWARMSAPGAGPNRGFQWLPEVNDEVLVAFEHGDIHRPYILGGLWNDKDKPPSATSELVASNKTKLRGLTSREGLNLMISDESGGRSIKIAAPDDESKIEIRCDEKVVEILSNGDITITGTRGKIFVEGQDIEIKSSTNLKLNAGGNIELTAGANLDLNAQVNLTMKATAQASVEATGPVTIKGAMATLEGSATTTIKGGIVMIN